MSGEETEENEEKKRSEEGQFRARGDQTGYSDKSLHIVLPWIIHL